MPAAAENDAENYTNGTKESGIQSAEDVARMVWTFVKAAGVLAQGLEKEDDVKLLRVRTKKHELVIVPGISRTIRHITFVGTLTN